MIAVFSYREILIRYLKVSNCKWNIIYYYCCYSYLLGKEKKIRILAKVLTTAKVEVSSPNKHS